MNRLFKGKRKGFTLVELIVVIAILAILAGIAIPVYTNYIKKANQASDEQLIAAVNQAAAAAVLEVRGLDMAKLADGALTATTTNGKSITISDSADANVSDAFAKYFKGNEESSLKWYNSLVFKSGVFVGDLRNMKSIEFNGRTITFDADVISAYNESSFADNEMELLDIIDSLTGAVGSNQPTINSLVADAKFKAYLEKNGISTADGEAIGNALVTYSAERLAGLDSSAVSAAINGNFDHDYKEIAKMLSGTNSSSFSEKAAAAALLFGMSQGYANSEYGQSDSAASADVSSISDKASVTAYMNSLNSANFQAYLNSEQGQKDLASFIGLMDTINANSDVIWDYATDQGFGGGDLYDLIDQIRNAE